MGGGIIILIFYDKELSMKKILFSLVLLFLGTTFANAYDYGYNSQGQNNYQRQNENFQRDVQRRNQQMQSIGRDDFYEQNLPSTPQW